MFASLFLRLTMLLTLLASTPTTLSAVDWTGWLSGGKEISTAAFWDPTETDTYTGEFQPVEQLQVNMAKGNHIMSLAPEEHDHKPELTIHKIYRYNPQDFAIYRQKIPRYAQEQLALGHWINQLAKERTRNAEFISDVDNFYHHLESVAKGEKWLNQLQRELLAIRLNIEVETLEEHPDLEDFIKANALLRHLAYHRHKITIDNDGTPEVLVEGKQIPWTTFKKMLQLDSKGRVTNYFYTYSGFVPGRVDSVIKPFSKVNPNTYHHQHILEIATADIFPPHNWIRLIDPEGNVYSIGYWSTKPLKDLWGILQNLFPRDGRVTSPDPTEVAIDPHKILTTAIHITQDQFDDLLTYLQKYQEDPKQYEILSILGGENCATFVRQTAEVIGLKVKSSSWIRPFNNPYDVMDWQNMVAKWRRQALRKDQNLSEQQKLDIEYGLPR